MADLARERPRDGRGTARVRRLVDRLAANGRSFFITVRGEDLLDRVPLPLIRRLDVAKACFGLYNQVLLTGVVYPFLPDATRYAMDALKRSVHSCYFCHHGRPAALPAEIEYFQDRYGPDPALDRLLALRREYRRSFRFVLASAASIVRLYTRTMRDARFPLDARRPVPARAQLPPG